jgi:hypothetical protein
MKKPSKSTSMALSEGKKENWLAFYFQSQRQMEGVKLNIPQAQVSTKHTIWPRTMVKCLGNMPARSLPTGMELLLRLVANVAKAYKAQGVREESSKKGI